MTDSDPDGERTTTTVRVYDPTRRALNELKHQLRASSADETLRTLIRCYTDMRTLDDEDLVLSILDGEERSKENEHP